jgi:hypothetical protein
VRYYLIVKRLSFALCVVTCLQPSGLSQEWKSGVDWQEPAVVTPGATDAEPPSDAVVLFDGTNLDQWIGGEKWKIEDGTAIPQESGIRTRQEFGDIQLHVEWSAPTEIRGAGQGRGNSGVYLMGRYEIQVLDSYENPTYFDGQAGSIYKQTPPMVNAMRKPGEWNSYDIVFTAPRFRVNGDVESPAYVTLIHNGVVVQNHFELLGRTGFVEAPHYQPHAETGPIELQFHGDPVRFRNIWVRELKAPVGRRISAPFNLQRPKPAEQPEQQEKPKPEADPTDSEKQDSGPAEEADDEKTVGRQGTVKIP